MGWIRWHGMISAPRFSVVAPPYRGSRRPVGGPGVALNRCGVQGLNPAITVVASEGLAARPELFANPIAGRLADVSGELATKETVPLQPARLSRHLL
jgi:hypothetical protein